MIIDLSADEGRDGSASGISSLENWLAEEPALRKAARFERIGGTPEDMSVGGEVLRMVIEPGGLLTTLATVMGAWLASRSAGTRLRLRKGDVEVEVTARAGQDAEALATRLLKELKDI